MPTTCAFLRNTLHLEDRSVWSSIYRWVFSNYVSEFTPKGRCELKFPFDDLKGVRPDNQILACISSFISACVYAHVMEVSHHLSRIKSSNKKKYVCFPSCFFLFCRVNSKRDEPKWRTISRSGEVFTKDLFAS